MSLLNQLSNLCKIQENFLCQLANLELFFTALNHYFLSLRNAPFQQKEFCLLKSVFFTFNPVTAGIFE